MMLHHLMYVTHNEIILAWLLYILPRCIMDLKLEVAQSRPTVCNPWAIQFSSAPGQDTGVGSLSLLQEIFPTQGSNPGLPHCRQILYQLSYKGSPVGIVCLHFKGKGLCQMKKSTWNLNVKNHISYSWAYIFWRSLCFPGGPAVTNLAVQEVQETWVQSLNQDEPLKEEMATHSSILTWKIPWTEEPIGWTTVHGVTKVQTRLSMHAVCHFFLLTVKSRYTI